MFGKKDEYVVRHHSYHHIEEDGVNETVFGHDTIDYRGTKDNCVNFIKALYLEKAIASIDLVDDNFDSNLDLRDNRFNYTTIDYSKGRDYVSMVYTVDKYESWMEL